MIEKTSHRGRARIACVTSGPTPDDALTETCAKAGYDIVHSTSAGAADIAVLDLRVDPFSARRVDAVCEAVRRGSPECALMFLVDAQTYRQRAGALRRYGEVIVGAEALDHVAARMRECLRIRNISEEAGERLKSLVAVNRAVEFPMISADASPPRVLIVGPPGPAAMDVVNAVAHSAEFSACVLSAGQALRALDHQHFDIAIFLPAPRDSAVTALIRALRRHPRFNRTALLQIADTPGGLAAAARLGAPDLILREHISHSLTSRASLQARRARLVASMRDFLNACAGDGVRDAASGVFTPGFLGHHGARLAARADQTGRPLSVILARLSDAQAARRIDDRLALRQGARLIARVTRSEDLVARIAPGLFAIVCPATGEDDANAIALRVDGVLSNTAFQMRAGVAAHPLAIDVCVAARQHGENVSETIAAALRAMIDADALTPPQRSRQ